MPEPRYIQVAPRVEELYWQKTAGEIQEELDIGGSTYGRAKDHAGLPRKTNKNRLEYIYGVPADWLLDTLHNTLGKSVNQMSDELPVSRKWIGDKMDSWGLDRRGRSEAESHKWEQMSVDEREAQVKAAHETVRNNHASFRTNANGYESWRCGRYEKQHTVKTHRLLAVAKYGFDAVADNVVHHGPEANIPWANWPGNIQLFESNSEHVTHHNRERERDSLGRYE